MESLTRSFKRDSFFHGAYKPFIKAVMPALVPEIALSRGTGYIRGAHPPTRREPHAMAARKHHYVPQCYLKLFSVSHKKVPQLTVFDRVRKKVYKA